TVARRRFGTPDRDWTKGSVVGNLLSLSWPMILSGSLNMLGPTIDMVWVGRLGDDAVASVGVAGTAVMLMQSLVMGLFVGLQAVIARAIGAGDKKAAVHAANQGMVISTAIAIIMAAVGWAFADDILSLIGSAPEVVRLGGPYLRIMLIASVTMSFQWVTNATMVASGDTVKPLWIAAAFRAFHIALSPVLIFGLWIFPEMGVNGAAITNVFSLGLGAAIGMWFLFTGKTRLHLTLKGFRVDFQKIWQMVKIGIPASISNIDRTLSGFVLIAFVTGFGTLSVAAHTIGQRVDMFILMPAMAFGQATGILAAQNLGASQPERAVRTAWTATGYYSAFMVLVAIAIFFFAEGVIRVFSPEPELIVLGATYLRIQILAYLVFPVIMIIWQSLNIVGDTIFPMALSLFTNWGILLPLAIYLPKWHNLGVLGIWWAMVIALVVRAIVVIIYFIGGRWLRKRI
ncbi:MAG: MATE family efflux transporter, partial [Dehalococcoidales bacterium]|nr:MATE family efflux transporter [Dehalococcoidales bacterium]